MRLKDADALLKKFPTTVKTCNGAEKFYAVDCQSIIDIIISAPTINYPIEQIKWERDIAIEQLKSIGKGLGETMDDVQPVKRGKWITERWDDLIGRTYCSVCGHDAPSDGDEVWRSLWCPNCGAKMENA